MANIITDVSGAKNVRMTNAQCARQPIASIFTGWATLRVALRLRIADTGANITGPPLFGFGLCAGSTNILGDATTDHFAGVMSDEGQVNETDWTRAAGPPVTYRSRTYPMKRVGATYTQGASLSLFAYLYTARYKLFFIDITTGSPNYTFKAFQPDAAVDSDATSADFLLQAVATIPAFTGHSNTGTATLAIDEGVDGTFTHACAWWNQLGSTIDIADFQVFKVA